MTPEEFEELLPWYATGALEPDEARAVEEHLARSPDARAELAKFRVLHEVVQDTSGEPEFNPGLVNDALARIDAYERERAERAEGRGLVGWLRSRLLPAWEGTPTLARAALGAQLALMIALGGALLLPDGERFTTVGGGARAEQARIAVGFGGAVSEAELRQLVKDLDGAIVAGPSALGLYTIELPLAADARAEIDAVLEQLRERPGLVRYAGRVE
jgi:anti-sigma factor RsiW